MSDGPDESAVERLLVKWREMAGKYRAESGVDVLGKFSDACRAEVLDMFSDQLARALEEDGVIPSRMK